MGTRDFGSLDVLPELRRFKEALSQRFRISKMILFGSRARGDHLRTSDVDLIIVSPDFQGIPFLQRIRAVVELWDSDLALEVLPYTPEEFSRKAQEIGIVSRALREGLEI